MKPKPEGFPRAFRLNDPSEFTRVLESAAFRRRSGPLRVMASANTMHTARIGLIVGKRVQRRAVDRNRVKRVVREVFRLNRPELPEADIVVQLVSSASASDIRAALVIVFGELRNRCQ